MPSISETILSHLCIAEPSFYTHARRKPISLSRARDISNLPDVLKMSGEVIEYHASLVEEDHH